MSRSMTGLYSVSDPADNAATPKDARFGAVLTGRALSLTPDQVEIDNLSGMSSTCPASDDRTTDNREATGGLS